MLAYTPTKAEREIIRITMGEITEWENGNVWVTDKVKYRMLGSGGVISKARKNYLGKFDNERDAVTGKKKFFPPLTMDMVETVRKNIDLDSADINIRATNPNGFSSALILRYLLGYFMRKNYFGEVLNELLGQFCIDGTVVLKTRRDYDRRLGKQVISTPIPDITNCLIDPSEKNIQDAGAFIERNVLKLSEAKSYPWNNLQYLEGEKDLSRFKDIGIYSKREVPYSEIYERWGDLPLWVLPPKERRKAMRRYPKLDKNDWVPAMAVISRLPNNPVVHEIKFNEDGIKPYEETQFRKVFGRWHGMGVGEMLLGLQSYIAETVNLRLNQARIAQMGLFKFRKGSGITQQKWNSLMSGGLLPVTRMEDIAELRVTDVKPSSYKDEQGTRDWSQRVTGAFEIGRGEQLPASQPATTAVLQERGMRSGFDLLQENLGMFLSRIFERHIIPLLLETISDKEIISIVGSPKELKEIDESFINHQINGVIWHHYQTGKGFPDPNFIENLRKRFRDSLDTFHKTRYFRIPKKKLTEWKYEVEVFITGESFNKTVMVRQLNDILINYQKVPGVNLDTDAVMKEILDLMGLGGARFFKGREEVSAVPPVANVPTPAAPRQFEETERVGEAATAERTGRGGIR